MTASFPLMWGRVGYLNIQRNSFQSSRAMFAAGLLNYHHAIVDRVRIEDAMLQTLPLQSSY